MSAVSLALSLKLVAMNQVQMCVSSVAAQLVCIGCNLRIYLDWYWVGSYAYSSLSKLRLSLIKFRYSSLLLVNRESILVLSQLSLSRIVVKYWLESLPIPLLVDSFFF